MLFFAICSLLVCLCTSLPLLIDSLTPALGFSGVAVHPADQSILGATGSGNRVFRLFRNGSLIAVAGTGASGFAGDGGPATSASFNTIYGVTVVPQSNDILICDYQNNRLRMLYSNGTVRTWAGSGSATPSGDGGAAIAAGIRTPMAAVWHPTDTSLYISCANVGTVRRIAGGIITTVFSGINSPYGITFRPSDMAFVVAANGQHRLLMATNGSTSLFTWAGTSSSFSDGNSIGSTPMYFPSALTYNRFTDEILFVDWFHRIRRITNTSYVYTVAGSSINSNTGGFAGDGGPATSALLNYPFGLAVMDDGSILVADSSNGRIRRVAEPAIRVLTFTRISVADALATGLWVSDAATEALIIVKANISLPSSIPSSACFFARNDTSTPWISQLASNGFRINVSMVGGRLPCAHAALTADETQCPIAACCTTATWTCIRHIDAGVGWSVSVEYTNVYGTTVAFPAAFGAMFHTPLSLNVSLSVPPGQLSSNTTGLMTLCGQNMGYHLSKTLEQPRIVWSPASRQLSLTFLNESCAVVTWNVSAAAVPWFYQSHPMVYVVANTSVTVTPRIIPASVQVVSNNSLSSHLFTWGDDLIISGPGLMLVGFSSVKLSAANITLPCVNMTRLSDDSCSCNTHYVATAWQNQSMRVILGFPPNSSQSQVIADPSEPIIFEQQLSMSVTISSWVESSVKLHFPTFVADPVTMLQHGVISTSSAAFQAWVGGSVAAISCHSLDAHTLTCLLPSTADLSLPLQVQLFQALNMTSHITNMRPRVVASPDRFSWGDRITFSAATLGDELPKNITFIQDDDEIGGSTGLPCMDIAVINSSSIACTARFVRDTWLSHGMAIVVEYETNFPRKIGATSMELRARRGTAYAWATPASSSSVNMSIVLPASQLSLEEIVNAGLPLSFATIELQAQSQHPCTAGYGRRLQCIVAAETVDPNVIFILSIGPFSLLVETKLGAAVVIGEGNYTFGDTITISVPAIDTTYISSVLLQRGGNVQSMLPCTPVVLTSNSTFQCDISVMHEEWVAAAEDMFMLVQLGYEEPAVLFTVPGLRFSSPVFSNVSVLSTEGWLSTAGGTNVDITTHYPLPEDATLPGLQLSLLPTRTCTASLAGIPSQNCSIMNSHTIRVWTPAAWLVLEQLELQLFGLFSATTGGEPLSYQPPLLLGIDDAPIFTSMAPRYISVNLTMQDKPFTGIAGHMSDIRIGGVPCDNTLSSVDCAVAGVFCLSTLTCANLSTSAFTELYGAQFAAIIAVNISFMWANRLVVTPPIVSVVLRPILSKIEPAAVRPDNLLLITVEHYALESICNGTGHHVFIGGNECSIVAMQSAFVACRVPQLPAAYIANSTAVPVIIQTCLGGLSKEYHTIAYVGDGDVFPLGTLPSQFVPSTALSPIPLMNGTLRFGVRTRTGETPLAATCTLSSDTPAATIVPITLLSLTSVTVVDGTVDFGQAIIISTHDITTVSLKVFCSGVGGETFQSFSWEVDIIPIVVDLCIAPPNSLAADQVIPPWSVVFLVNEQVGNATTTTHSMCEHPFSRQPLHSVFPSLPKGVCTTYVNSPVAAIQGGTAQINGSMAIFTESKITGVINASVKMWTDCTLGGVAIPSNLSNVIHVRGCPLGSQPFQATCVPCGDGKFSRGGMSSCQACPPAGAVCQNGLIQLLPRYYRPPSHSNRDIDSTTELHACFNEVACVVNTSTAEYGCSVGYTGPLCGVCDDTINYAAFGNACGPCWSNEANELAFAGLLGIFVSLLVFVAVRKPSGVRSEASIILRITLTFVQAVSSLRAFKATGKRAYYNLMGFSDTVSISPLSLGPVQCLLRPSFIGQYTFILILPVIATVGVIFTFVVVTVIRSCSLRPYPCLKLRAAGTTIRTWLAEKRYMSALLFMAQLSYMPIISASLKALDCVEPIGGRTYIRSDLSMECDTPTYQALRIVAVSALTLVGVGMPLAVFWVLWRATPAHLESESFRSSWGVLFDGYRVHATTTTTKQTGHFTPDIKGFQWWEALVLLRKAGIAIIAVLFTEELLQVVIATLWIGLFLLLQTRFMPYTKPVFNRLELLALLVMFATAITSTLLAEDDVTSASSDNQLTQLSSREMGVTITLLILNVGTLCILAGFWLYMLAQRVQIVLQKRSEAKLTTTTEMPQTPSIKSNPVMVVHLNATESFPASPELITNPLATVRHNRKAPSETPADRSRQEFAPSSTRALV